MLRSLGFGLGLETFAKFLMISVSVSKKLVSEKKYRFRFRKIWYRKKSLGIGFGQNFGIVIQWSRLTWSPALPSWAMPKRKKEYCFWNFHPFGVKWSYKESSKHVILYLNCTQARSGYHLFGGEYCFFCLKNSRKCSIFFQRCFFSSVHVWIRESAHERIRTNLKRKALLE